MPGILDVTASIDDKETAVRIDKIKGTLTQQQLQDKRAVVAKHEKMEDSKALVSKAVDNLEKMLAQLGKVAEQSSSEVLKQKAKHELEAVSQYLDDNKGKYAQHALLQHMTSVNNLLLELNANVTQ